MVKDQSSNQEEISIHAPARGATNQSILSGALLGISIHAPARGATKRRRGRTCRSTDFNPRSREGSDEKEAQMIRDYQISIHAPARGATVYNRRLFRLLRNFNPRSREGSDKESLMHW